MVLEVTLITVFIAALITALTTGLGALPLAISTKIDQKWLSIGAAVAAMILVFSWPPPSTEHGHTRSRDGPPV
ncbi:hypothetical protein [Marinobacter sp. es.042]|uniref:hypothetical protein n=1 Tax=Marinobacter sp. es.042 TaxID=1761794 RepID=UPI000B506C84|nr:hypothetical protein [Marinobacter sp. es.042]